MTLEEAKALKQGTIIHHATNKNADGTPQRWRVTSVKTWKRDPSRIAIGVKHGLRRYDTVTQHDLHLVTIA